MKIISKKEYLKAKKIFFIGSFILVIVNIILMLFTNSVSFHSLNDEKVISTNFINPLIIKNEIVIPVIAFVFSILTLSFILISLLIKKELFENLSTIFSLLTGIITLSTLFIKGSVINPLLIIIGSIYFLIFIILFLTLYFEKNSLFKMN